MSDTDKIRNILKSHIELMEKQRKGVAELLGELNDTSAKLTLRTILARFDAEIILSQMELIEPLRPKGRRFSGYA